MATATRYAVTTPAGDAYPGCDEVLSWHRTWEAARKRAEKIRRSGRSPVAAKRENRVNEPARRTLGEQR